MRRSRRQFLGGACMACLAGSASAFGLDRGAGLFSRCKDGIPQSLLRHEVVQAAFAGLEPARMLDVHAHLLGTGDSGSGCYVSKDMESWLHPRQMLQKKFFLNAACVDKSVGTVDRDFVARLLRLADEFPAGARLALLAFDQTYSEEGTVDAERAAFHVPNDYAAEVARAHPQRFGFIASVHPYRPDAAEELARVARKGALAIKWLPSAMGIDPASPRCDPAYAALARLKLPLLSHAGEERAVEGAHQQHFGNPLRLRRALDHGVTVIVAHCATMGEDRDLDQGPRGPWQPSFDLFARLMEERRYEGRLFGDISAVTQANRARYLPQLLARREWQARLLNGSDYPLPGVMPLFRVDSLVEQGWLDERAAAVIKPLRDYNPLLFDFVLKRSLRIDGQRFDDAVFQSARLLPAAGSTTA